MVRWVRMLRRLPKGLALRVAGTYALLAGLWILVSDRVAGWLFQDPEVLTRVALVKGWVFVAVTAALLFGFLATQADERLALVEAAEGARVVPFRWEREWGVWQMEASLRPVLGLDPESLARKASLLEARVHPGDQADFALARQRVLGGSPQAVDLRMQRADGVWIATRWTLHPTGTGFQGAFQDVTELRETRRRLTTSQRREVLSVLAGGLVHDLRNLLVVIQVRAEMLDQVESEEERKASAALILRSAERATGMLQRLLHLARGEGTAQQVARDVGGLVTEVVDLLRPGLPGHLTLVTDLAPELPLVRVDPDQILMVLLNLVNNARDAMPEPGAITLRTGMGIPPGTTGWSASEAVPMVYAEVADTGTGIAPEHLGRLFEPFFTTKEGDQGTGLGLSSAQGIAREHGGVLTCDSRLGEGSRFRLWLPAAQETAQVAPGPMGSQARPKGLSG